MTLWAGQKAMGRGLKFLCIHIRGNRFTALKCFHHPLLPVTSQTRPCIIREWGKISGDHSLSGNCRLSKKGDRQQKVEQQDDYPHHPIHKDPLSERSGRVKRKPKGVRVDRAAITLCRVLCSKRYKGESRGVSPRLCNRPLITRDELCHRWIPLFIFRTVFMVVYNERRTPVLP